MLKGVLVGLGIIVICALIPIVHFISLPASPFLAGYFGISYAGESNDSYGVKGLKFGALLGLFVLVISGIVAAGVLALFGSSQRILVVVWIGVVVFTLYAGSMASLGAMYASLRNQNKKTQAEAAPAD